MAVFVCFWVSGVAQFTELSTGPVHDWEILCIYLGLAIKAEKSPRLKMAGSSSVVRAFFQFRQNKVFGVARFYIAQEMRHLLNIAVEVI